MRSLHNKFWNYSAQCMMYICDVLEGTQRCLFGDDKTCAVTLLLSFNHSIATAQQHNSTLDDPRQQSRIPRRQFTTLYALVEVKQLLRPRMELRFEVLGRNCVFWGEEGNGRGQRARPHCCRCKCTDTTRGSLGVLLPRTQIIHWICQTKRKKLGG